MHFFFGAATILPVALALAEHGGGYVVPLDDPAIQYASGPVADVVSLLQKKIDRGEVKLEFDPVYGYLPAVLRNLHAPVASQVLVYSKTSFQAIRISPRMPRALYFNDSVAVGWVRGGEVVEVAAADPRQGIVFYTLDQGETAHPSFARRDECLQCHYNAATLGVPGLMVRSVHTDYSGAPLLALPAFVTDHRSPLKERWGGWFVTGTHGTQTHMGNQLTQRDGSILPDSPKNDNLTDLSRLLDTGAYLAPHSDIVALMVLEHQTRMQNLFTRVGFDTRIAMAPEKTGKDASTAASDSEREPPEKIEEELVQYLLFSGETRLESPIKGTSNFAKEFASQGPRDHRGRSLRQFDLTHRMFLYPCSYLIYSDSFDHLPRPALQRIYKRLWEVLTGRDQSPAFAHLSAADRQAILEILIDTKTGLPHYFSIGSTSTPAGIPASH
jgi:hypothetical protein